MQIELIHESKALPLHEHKGEQYAEAPKKGAYAIRLRNDSPSRKLAVLSVDGVNVLDGEDAAPGGPGYVLGPWEAIEIPGWRRGDKTVATFEFKEEKKSYAAQTGRGTGNVGVIGCAVFDEKVVVKPTVIEKHIHHHHHDNWPWRRPWDDPYRPIWMAPSGTICSTNADDATYGSSATLSATNSVARSNSSPHTKSVVDVGTGYGAEMTFHTTSTEFKRASDTPAAVIQLRYATRERLKKMGVDLTATVTRTEERGAPDPFPASRGMRVPAPPNWRG